MSDVYIHTHEKEGLGEKKEKMCDLFSCSISYPRFDPKEVIKSIQRLVPRQSIEREATCSLLDRRINNSILFTRQWVINIASGNPVFHLFCYKLTFSKIRIWIGDSVSISTQVQYLKRGESDCAWYWASVWNSGVLIRHINAGVKSFLTEICPCAQFLSAQPHHDKPKGCQHCLLPFLI